MAVLIGVAIGVFLAVTVGFFLWSRPREDGSGLSPEREGTSYEEPQDEGAAELEEDEPVQEGGEGSRSG
jgi:hypothetical protein